MHVTWQLVLEFYAISSNHNSCRSSNPFLFFTTKFLINFNTMLKISKPSIKGILEKLDKLSKSNQLRYMTNGRKKKKNFFLTPWFGSSAVGYKIHHCSNFYWVVLHSLILFSRHCLDWLGVHKFVEEICFNV